MNKYFLISIILFVIMMLLAFAGFIPAAQDYAAMHPWEGEPHHDYDAIRTMWYLLGGSAICGAALVYTLNKSLTKN